MDEYFKQAFEIVKAQASVRSMTEDEMSSMFLKMSKTFQDAMTAQNALPEESLSEVPDEEETNIFGTCKNSIKEKSVTCLECGKKFRIITKRHLTMHNLTLQEYLEKHGYQKGTKLVCKALQRERKEKMKDMALWERRRSAKEIVDPKA